MVYINKLDLLEFIWIVYFFDTVPINIFSYKFDQTQII